MEFWGLVGSAAAAVVFILICTTLPGMLALLHSLIRRPGWEGRPQILGPLFWYELTRLARRGQQPKLRSIYAGILLIGLLVTYLDEFREVNPLVLSQSSTALFSLDRMANFSQNFLIMFLLCQLVGLLLITPVYAGGAIADERERGTLDYLRSSLLTNREIIAAFLTARLVYVASFVLTGLPILSLTMLFGGVDGLILLGGFVVAFMTILSLGSLCMYLAVQGRGLREILIWTYMLTGVVCILGMCCWFIPVLGTASPLTVTVLLLWGDSRAAMGGNYSTIALVSFVLTHGVVAMYCVWRSTQKVRVIPPAWKARVVKVKARPMPDRPAPVEETKPHRRRARPAARAVRVPRLGNSPPLLWKERYFSGQLPVFEHGLVSGCLTSLLVLGLFPIGLWMFIAVFNLVSTGDDPSVILNPLARVVLTGAACLLPAILGIRTAVSVVRERQNQTLDGLLSLPLPWSEILRYKLYAALYWVRYLVLIVVVVLAIAAAFGAIHPLGFLVALSLFFAHLVFAAVLGLWLSVFCHSGPRAVTRLLIVLGMLALTPFLLSTLTRGAFQASGIEQNALNAELVMSLFSVPYAVYELVFRWGDFVTREGNKWPMLVSGVLVTATYVLASWLVWRNAKRRFANERM